MVIVALSVGELKVEKNMAKAVTSKVSTRMSSTAWKRDPWMAFPLTHTVAKNIANMMAIFTTLMKTRPKYFPSTNFVLVIGLARIVYTVRRSISFVTRPIPTKIAMITPTRLIAASPTSLTILACSPMVNVPRRTDAQISNSAKNTRLYRILSRTVSRKVLRATTRRLCISHLPVCLLKKNLFERSFVRDHRNESPPCLSNRHENFLYFVLSWDNHPAAIPSLQQSNRSALDQRNFFTNKALAHHLHGLRNVSAH